MIQYTNVSTGYNEIQLRGIDLETGEHIAETVDFSPVYYIPTSAESPYTDFPSKVKALEPQQFGHSNSYRDFYKELRQSGPIFGRPNVEYDYIYRHHYNRDDYKTDHIRRFILDIEVHADEFPKPDQAKFPINACTVYDSATKEIHVFHTKEGWELENSELFQNKLLDEFNLKARVKEHFCSNEQELLHAFVRFWVANYPDVVSGWNSDNFDMRYFFYRVPKVCSESVLNRMSPFHNVYTKQRKNNFGNKEEIVVFDGIASLDYLQLYLKHTFKKRENYKLDTIAHIELGMNKLSYEEYENLHELADQNPQKFIDYNILDVLLVELLDRKLGLFDLVFDIAYLAGINFEDVGSPVRIWDNLVHNHLEDQHHIAMMFPPASDKETLAGAHVKDTQIGFHKWIVSFDLASLYPSIIRQWNIGPDTKVHQHGFQRDNFVQKILSMEQDGKADETRSVLKGLNCCMAANGILYTNDFEGCFKYLMNKLYTERKQSKTEAGQAKQRGEVSLAKKLNTRQLALKILLNSGYGALAQQYFRFSDIELAESITLTGQLVSHWAFKELNDYMNKMVGTSDIDYIIAGDTDSLVISFDRFVKKFAKTDDEDKITEFLNKSAKVFERKCLAPGYERLKALLNCQESLMIMDREIIGSHAFWRKKKNYAIRVKDSEGWRPDKPEYKIMGLEAIKSNFNETDRNAMTKAIQMILDPESSNDDLLSFIDEYHDEYMSRTIEDIASASRVNYISRYSDSKGNCLKGCPKNSRAAIVYNRLLKQKGLDKKYPLVNEGDSIYILELKMPNPIHESVVGFIDFLPKEFELNDWIDREGLFETNFYNPVVSYCEAVGWKYDDTPDLGSFF